MAEHYHVMTDNITLYYTYVWNSVSMPEIMEFHYCNGI